MILNSSYRMLTVFRTTITIMVMSITAIMSIEYFGWIKIYYIHIIVLEYYELWYPWILNCLVPYTMYYIISTQQNTDVHTNNSNNNNLIFYCFLMCKYIIKYWNIYTVNTYLSYSFWTFVCKFNIL